MRLNKTSKYKHLLVISILFCLMCFLLFLDSIKLLRDVIVLFMIFNFLEIIDSLKTYDITEENKKIILRNIYKTLEKEIFEIKILEVSIQKRNIAFIFRTNIGSYKINYTKKNYTVIKNILETKIEYDKLNHLIKSVNDFFSIRNKKFSYSKLQFNNQNIV